MTDKILSRLEFFYEMRDVLRDEKPQSSASGLVNISDVLDFIFDLGLEVATLFAFDEDKDLLVFTFDEDSDTTLSSSDEDEDLIEVSDIE